MTVTAELVRRLLAQGEGTKLDFKEKDYDWTNEGKHELAKDLMAMANVKSIILNETSPTTTEYTDDQKRSKLQ